MKKRILLTLAAISLLALASCQNGVNPNQTGKYRGTVDETIDPNLDIPDAIKPKGDAEGYIVKHELENKNGGYDLVSQENLAGEVGKLTNAQTKEFPGYVAQEFSQKTITKNGDIVIEIKYKALKFTLSLEEISSNIGIVSGSGEYYTYDNNAILTAKPNIGYDFIGWYDGDELLSEDKTYSFNITSNLDINAKFEVSDSFKYFEFTSTQSSCVIKGLVAQAPETLIIPEGVTEIETSAFYNDALSKVILPKTLNTIGSYAFEYSTILSLVINSKPEIGDDAFYGCNRLYEIFNSSSENASDKLQLEIDSTDYGYIAYYARVIHDSLNDNSLFSVVGDYLFMVENDYPTIVAYSGTDSDLVLPETVTIGDNTYEYYSIGASAFMSNKSINMVTIPESVENIGNNAFYGCSNLYEVYNLSPDIYTSTGSEYNGYLGYYAKVVHDSDDAPQQVFRTDNMIYYTYTSGEEKWATILSYKVTSSDLVIDAIEDYSIEISSNLFQGNKLIETVTLDNNVKVINDYVFNGCTNMKSFKADGVTYIGIRAVSGCTSLKSVSIKSCKTAYNYSFSSDQVLKELDISSMETIGAYAFQYCSSLYEITLPESLSQINTNAFQYCNKLKQVINKSNLSISRSTSNGYVGWYSANITDKEDNFLDKTGGYVTYKDGEDKVLLAYIGDSKTLTIPEDIVKVYDGALAFGDYTSISFKAGTQMASSVLYKCDNLETLDVPYDYYFGNLFSSVGSGSSSRPEKLKTLRITGENISIDSYSFDSVSSVENIVFACSIGSIGYQPFSYLKGLKSVYFDGTMLDWLDYSFEEETYTPMYYASNFYIKDSNGDNTLFGNKYSLIDELEIPETVTELGNYQFYGFGIKKLTLPATISNFGNNVFKNCKSLEEVTFLEETTSEEVTLVELTYIPNGLFSGCSSLEAINIPDSVTEIGESAFYGCSGLRSISITENITSIGAYAFAGCSNITTIKVPSSITEINEGVFRYCYGVQKIQLLGDVTRIGDYAFGSCYTLNSINLPSTIEYIGVGAFQNCEAIKNISLKDLAITEISSYLFSGCRSLASVTLPNSIETIGDHAFDNCRKLVLTSDGKGGNYFGPEDNPYKWFIKADKTAVDIEVKDGCEIVLESAFSACKNLKSLIIPNSVVSLGKILEFNQTIEVLSVPFLGNGTTNQTLNYMFGYTSTTYTYVPRTLRDLTITGNITEIANNAFRGASYLKTINIPDSVTSIGTYAFYQTGITSLKLGENIVSLGERAFASCTSLTSIDLSEVTSSCELGSYLFNGCTSLVSADLGGINKVAEYMFLSCTKLTNVTLSNNLTTIDWYGFSLTNIKSFVAPSTLKTINNHAFEKSSIEFADLSQMDGANTYLMDSAFQECASLTKVILPNLKKINSYAFYKCPNLEECDLPESLEELGQYVFAYSGLKHVVLPTNLKATTTGTGEFIYNEKLESVEIKCTNSSYISSKPFQGCTNIKTAILYEGVKNVSKLLFCDCTSLTSVTLPSTITTINQSAFNTCSSLTSIVIPANVTSIGDYAFSSCTKLLEVYNLSNLEFEIGSSTYGNVTKNALVIHTSLSEPSIFETDSDGFIFIDVDSKGYLFGYEGSEEEITLPESYTKNNVTYNSYDIFEGAFKNNTTLKKVTIPGSVETLGKSAFEGCSEITDITILDGLKYIQDRAFYNCTSLVNLSLPNSLYRVYGEYPFTNCGNLKTTTYEYNKYLGNENNPYLYLYGRTTADMNSLTIHSDCKLIGSRALTSLTYVTNVVIPEGVIGIGDYAFYECNTVTSISFPTTLEYINSYSFAHMSKLKKVLLANTKVVELGSSAFDNDLNGESVTNVINEITLPSTLKKIGSNCFARAAITSIVIPEGVEYIGNNAFDECTNLTDVTLPSTITELGEWLFSDNSALTNLRLACKNVTFKQYSFKDCSSLENVYYDGTIEDWLSNTFETDDSTPMCYGMYFYLKDSTGTIEYDGNNYKLLEDVVIPEGVEEIKSYTFYGFRTVTSVSFPSTLTKIGTYAFKNNLAITEVNLPSQLVTIGSYAFSACINLQTLTISESVEKIGSGAFSNCTKLKNVRVKTLNAEFGSSVFDYDQALENVYYDGTIGDWAKLSFANESASPMYNTNKPMTFYILDNSGSVTYDGANYTKLEDVIIPNTVTKIGQYTFRNFNQIKTLTVPESVTEIGLYAFYRCEGLTYVELSEGLKTIATYAFCNCYSLVRINLPSTLTAINSNAFSNCYDLVEVYNLSSLSNLTKGSSYWGYVCYYAMAVHKSLTDKSILTEDANGYVFAYSGDKGYLVGYKGSDTILKLPTSFEYDSNQVDKYDIYQFAFYYNKEIEAVIVPEGVEVIASNAFAYCSKLSYIVIPSTITTVGTNSFYQCNVLYKVFYASTSEAWNTIASAIDNTLKTKTKYYYSETQPAPGNYWHFDSNGLPAIWM